MKKPRPPIVTVLGHVDHGKTSLLDAIRKTRLADREAGGITQGIGASKISTKEGDITFLDTPGHEAFSDMRARGAKVADIAILVVAADDGVMPQTEEAIKYLKDTGTPFIVAFTKSDLPSANVDQARSQLEQKEIFFEGRGGETPSQVVSSKKDEGITELLELIHLLAGVSEISGDDEGELEAYVIETNKDKRGVVVSAVIKNGTLKVGADISSSGIKARVRGLFNQESKPVKEVKPGDPTLILGFSELPQVGDTITIASDTKTQNKAQSSSNEIPKIADEEIAIVVKVQSAGSIDAIQKTLPEGAIPLKIEVGDIVDSDIFLAKSANAIVVAFESKIPGQVKKLAETEGVTVKTFRVIYELIDYIKEEIEKIKLQINGKAEILAIFPYNNKKVAGCKVAEGTIKMSDKVQVLRGEKQLGTGKITSLRRGKNELSQALVGEECGIIVSPAIEFEEGDTIIALKS